MKPFQPRFLKFAEPVPRAVGGPVIDNDQFPGREGLSVNTPHRFSE